MNPKPEVVIDLSRTDLEQEDRTILTTRIAKILARRGETGASEENPLHNLLQRFGLNAKITTLDNAKNTLKLTVLKQ